MQNFIKKYSVYFDTKSLKLVEKCFIVSTLVCLGGMLLLSFYKTYYISNLLYQSSIIIFRTGLMIGLFPPAFALIIGKWKKEH